MIQEPRQVHVLVAAVLLLVAGCATPVMPTGGPPDRTPPALVSSVPAADSVNVSTDRLLLTFSKPVEEASLRNALAIAPDFPTPPRVTVRGRSAEIRFPDDLRDNTTYVVTIGTDLRDLRNNRLPAPITIAFATGPQLDEGTIEGWVRSPRTGRGVSGINLFAYARPDTTAPLPDPRSVEPDYRTQTDNQGRFAFSYLRDVPFFVVAVDDRNRNRRADPGERFAVPPATAVLPRTPADSLTAPPLALFATRIDTVAAEPLRIRNRSEIRFAVRFTEPVRLADRSPDAFAVTDSVSQQQIAIRDVYVDEDPSQIVFATERMAPGRYRFDVVRPSAVVDTVGNPVRPSPLFFTPSTADDESRAEFVGFKPSGPDSLRTLRPGQPPAVIFSQPPAISVTDLIEVRGNDGERFAPVIESRDGLSYRILLEREEPIEVRVRQPDTTHVMRFRPMPADSLGDLSGRVITTNGEERIIVEAHANDGDPVVALADENSAFMLRGLPAGTVQLRVFADRDGSGQWSGGQLAPYREPEPLRVIPDVRVRARWEVELDPVVLDPSEAAPPAATAPDPEPDEPEDDLGRALERFP